MKKCTVLSHLAFEDLGLLEPVLSERGFTTKIVDVPSQGVPTDFADLMIILGGPIGVYQSDIYPFLTPELAAIRTRLSAGAPTLGICLGAQLMALALGGKVGPNPNGKEIGWSNLNLTEDGKKGPLRHLMDRKVLHWHGDKIDPPAGVQVLASTPITDCQAFSIGHHTLGLQFHPEPSASGLERWLVGHTAELSAARIDIPSLRADNQFNAPLLPQSFRIMAHEWLREANL
jgi:GMP synthase (glutamine-hydrolysing)